MSFYLLRCQVRVVCNWLAGIPELPAGLSDLSLLGCQPLMVFVSRNANGLALLLSLDRRERVLPTRAPARDRLLALSPIKRCAERILLVEE